MVLKTILLPQLHKQLIPPEPRILPGKRLMRHLQQVPGAEFAAVDPLEELLISAKIPDQRPALTTTQTALGRGGTEDGRDRRQDTSLGQQHLQVKLGRTPPRISGARARRRSGAPRAAAAKCFGRKRGAAAAAAAAAAGCGGGGGARCGGCVASALQLGASLAEKRPQLPLPLPLPGHGRCRAHQGQLPPGPLRAPVLDRPEGPAARGPPLRAPNWAPSCCWPRAHPSPPAPRPTPAPSRYSWPAGAPQIGGPPQG
mmetsp:Transcript_70968/g.191066  ORF Transcript_70968/g.191066 Transcript_70968/m.191066 type:complete len:256 (-) Transcript_70968:230-997(-)